VKQTRSTRWSIAIARTPVVIAVKTRCGFASQPIPPADPDHVTQIFRRWERGRSWSPPSSGSETSLLFRGRRFSDDVTDATDASAVLLGERLKRAAVEDAYVSDGCAEKGSSVAAHASL
jgi:hypothetical protein